MGRHGRDRHRPRPAVRRPAARVVLLGVGLPGQRPGHRRRARRGHRARPGEARSASRAASTSSAPALSIAALVSLVYGVIEAPERGWTSPLDPEQLRGRGSARRRIRALGAAHARADARPLVLPQSALQRRLRRHQRRVLLAVRRDLRAHAVPAVREGLQRAPGRSRDGAARLRPRGRRRIAHQARGAARHHPGRHRRPARRRRPARGDASRGRPRWRTGRSACGSSALALSHRLDHGARRPSRSWAPCPRRRPASARR